MYGEIEVVSYDWVKQEEQSREYGQPKPAQLVLDRSVKVRTPSCHNRKCMQGAGGVLLFSGDGLAQ